MDLSSSECLGVQDMHHHSMACLKALRVVAAFVTCTACPKASACQGMELNVGSLGPAQCTAHSSLQVIFKLVKSTAAMMAHILMALEKVFRQHFLLLWFLRFHEIEITVSVTGPCAFHVQLRF